MEVVGWLKLWCILTFSVTIGTCAKIDDCGSKIGNFSSVTITNCERSPVCILRRNTNVTIQFEFTPYSNVKAVNAVVHGITMGVPIPFHFPGQDACSHGLKCPLFKGKTYSYHATFQIQKKYPRLSLEVKWELKNEDRRDIVCLLIPARIK